MGFDFFKKKDKKHGNGGDSPFADDLEFDDIETSGEFLSGSEGNHPPSPPPPPPPPPPVSHARPTSPAYPPPPPPQAQPPVYPPPVTPPRPAQPFDDDLTVVNRPPVVPPVGGQPQPPAPPMANHAGPVPPGAPVRPGPPVNQPPAYPANGYPAPGPGNVPAPPVQPVSPPPPPSAPPGMSADEVTQVLNKPVSNEALVAWLVVTAGPMRGEDFRLPGGTARLGVHPDCEICITGDKFISAQHAEIRFQGGAYGVHDLNSRNGLFVNETRVTQTALEDGDKVKVGTTVIVFKSVKI